MKEIPLTSVSIYEFQCDDLLTERVFNKIKSLESSKELVWLPEMRENISRIGYMDNDAKTHFYDEELFDWFASCLNEVSDKFLNQKKLDIVDAWLTKAPFGYQSQEHLHVNSILSGCFYFQDMEKAPILFRYMPLIFEKLHLFYASERNMETKKISPAKGKLIIFPSWLLHSISMNRAMEVRYSLAFNTFFTDVLSSNPSSKLSLKPLSPKDYNQ